MVAKPWLFSAVYLYATVLLAQFSESVTAEMHGFYYLWYGEPEVDGEYKHWNHEILPHWNEHTRNSWPHTSTFSPPEELHSPYYPARGPYSSRNKTLLRDHFTEMHDHGFTTAVVSWWGRPDMPGTHDTQGVNTDSVIIDVLDAAASAGLFIAFHLEPYHGRDATNIRKDIAYLNQQYGNHPGLLKRRVVSSLHSGDEMVSSACRPVLYAYDSYHIQPEEWHRVLHPNTPLSIRGTADDAIVIGLWLNSNDGQRYFSSGPTSAGFDGFYTYFASDGFSYGSSTRNWREMQQFAVQHNKLFIASIGPGYDDTRIRPWNAANRKQRREGDYYRKMFAAAMAAGARSVSVTSYNEWGEGTQIEPAVPHTTPPTAGFDDDMLQRLGASRESSDYGSLGAYGYMQLTKDFATELQRRSESDEVGTARLVACSEGPGDMTTMRHSDTGRDEL